MTGDVEVAAYSSARRMTPASHHRPAVVGEGDGAGGDEVADLGHALAAAGRR